MPISASLREEAKEYSRRRGYFGECRFRPWPKELCDRVVKSWKWAQKGEENCDGLFDVTRVKLERRAGAVIIPGVPAGVLRHYEARRKLVNSMIRSYSTTDQSELLIMDMERERDMNLAFVRGMAITAATAELNEYLRRIDCHDQ